MPHIDYMYRNYKQSIWYVIPSRTLLAIHDQYTISKFLDMVVRGSKAWHSSPQLSAIPFLSFASMLVEFLEGLWFLLFSFHFPRV